MKRFKRAVCAALGVAALAAPVTALAHITLENKEAKAGSTIKFVLRVPHGCAGSSTIAVKIALPPELTEAKPEPKPGWVLTTKVQAGHDAAAGLSADGHGSHENEVVKEIAWSGGKLEDAHHDEFIFRAKVSNVTRSEIYVPVVQQCEKGTDRWIEIPPSGGSANDLKFPAPSIKVLSTK